MPTLLTDELVEFVESGVTNLVATRDAELRPECMRGAGTLVAQDRKTLTLLVPEATAGRTLRNVADNGRIAATFSRPVDHRTVQIKGTVVHSRPATEDERLAQERYLASLVEQLYWVGLPRSVVRRMRCSPAVALSVRIEAIFDQTPGPGAGKKLGQR